MLTLLRLLHLLCAAIGDDQYNPKYDKQGYQDVRVPSKPLLLTCLPAAACCAAASAAPVRLAIGAAHPPCCPGAHDWFLARPSTLPPAGAEQVGGARHRHTGIHFCCQQAAVLLAAGVLVHGPVRPTHRHAASHPVRAPAWWLLGLAVRAGSKPSCHAQHRRCTPTWDPVSHACRSKPENYYTGAAYRMLNLVDGIIIAASELDGCCPARHHGRVGCAATPRPSARAARHGTHPVSLGPPCSPHTVVSFVVLPVRARGLLQKKMASTLIKIGDLAVWLVGQVRIFERVCT